MTDRDSPVTTDELHAYVDGVLPADRRAAVEAWIATHPDDAARVAEWQAQANAIRERYAAIAEEPTPERLALDRLTRQGRAWRAAAIAVVVAAFAIGGAIGWVWHGAAARAPSPFEVFASGALSAHKLYTAEVRHPIEVRAAEKHLIPWLSKRVGTTLPAPDLESFSLKLLGGRLLPGPMGPAALFMYESPTGERYTFYSSKSNAPTTALRYNPAGDVAAVQWVESDYGFVVSGPADRDRLLKIAQTAYEQMESRSPARSSATRLISRRGS